MEDGIKVAVEALAKCGPLWLVLVVVIIAVVIKWPEIVTAHTARWKTKQETKQKLLHKHLEFTRLAEEREKALAGPTRQNRSPRRQGR